MADSGRSRTNEQWVEDLASGGERREQALTDLRPILLGGLRRGLSKWLEPYSEPLEELAQETTQEALLRILDRLHTFEGRSRFTTWAYKVAIHMALSALRRKQWQDVSLEQMLEPYEEDRLGMSLVEEGDGPEARVEQRDMLAQVERIIRDELSQDQLDLIQAVAVRGVPMEAVAQKLGVKRNALYKRMHDARMKLKRRLALEGLAIEDILAVFETGNTTPGRVVKRGDE